MSNWFRKLSQFKPMALPQGVKTDTPKNPDGYRNIDNQMSQETADSEQDIMPEGEYLSSGSAGIAVSCPNNTVCKYTDNKFEAGVAKLIMQSPQKHLVKVHDVRQIQNKPNLWAIQMEKCRTLDDFDYDLLNSIATSSYNKRENLDKYLNQARNNKYVSHYFKDQNGLQRAVELYNQFCDLHQELYRLGLSGDDAHALNLGWNSGGNLVLFDLGGSSWKNMRKLRNRPIRASVSNWFTKIAQAKPMAFPVQPDPSNGESFGRGYNKIYDNMTHETSEHEQTKYEDPQWLGSGIFGAAIECEPGVVCKYTMEPSEVEAANRIMNGHFRGVSRVLGIELVQNDPKIWSIRLEKCQTLDSAEKIIIHSIFRMTDAADKRQCNLIPLADVHDTLMRRYDENEFTVDEIGMLYDKYEKLICTLVSSGIDPFDAHEDNVGYNPQGELVLFDLGQSKRS